ncbi:MULTISPECIES: alpha/beta fold hydrolase [Streptomyces]|uniref:alpha/beta fold hydrolase n=1 Tax=Streptomyces TaxID=1883 RepID=UPI000A7D7388|nr:MULTISPECIES: alpha/beta fold hydrolase [Streptomyces]
MESIYRSTTGKELIRRWCFDQLEAWVVPHERRTVTAHGAQTHMVLAGSSATTVVFVPGTNFNAATSLPLATALVAAGYRVLLVDVPGQPGLSSGERALSCGRLPWYGAWLSDVLEKISSEPVVVMGHSFGAAIALSTDSSRISRLVLVSPGGLTKLRLTPAVLAASAAWFMRPADAQRPALACHARPRPSTARGIGGLDDVGRPAHALQRGTRRRSPARAATPPPGCHWGARRLPPSATARLGGAQHTRR